MEDSPLINTNQNNQSNVNTQNQASHVNNVLIVPIPNSTVDCTSSSSSSLSSSGSSSSSCSSSNSCCGPALSNYMPKSNSNPILSTSVTSSSLSTTSSSVHSPTSISSSHLAMSQPINKSTECVCAGSQKQHQLAALPSDRSAPQKSVMDLFMKKSPSNIENLSQYDSSSSSASTTTITTSTSNGNTTNMLPNLQVPPPHVTSTSNGSINTAIETAAKKYRCAAQVSEATCCWKGKLPPKQYKTPIVYSTKVFVGGLPWDITEEDIVKEFGVFGPCRVEWTNKEKFNLLSSNQVNIQAAQSGNESANGNPAAYDNNNNNQYNGQQQFRQNRSMSNLNNQQNKMNGNNQQQMVGSGDPLSSSKHRLSPGFAYVIYESEYSVRSLVGNCIEDYQNGRDRVEFYFKISTRRVRNKEVQIIPWILADNNFALCTPKELDPKKTVFVGNLHGTMTARDLAHIMNELFGSVVYAGIDIDKLKYPIGSGRVTFSHQQNFMRAVRAAFVDIQSSKFSKRIQIDPYLEDVQCCACYGDKGIYFCRDFQCFNYYCGVCWDKQHSYKQLGNHKPLMRKREDKF